MSFDSDYRASLHTVLLVKLQNIISWIHFNGIFLLSATKQTACEENHFQSHQLHQHVTERSCIRPSAAGNRCFVSWSHDLLLRVEFCPSCVDALLSYCTCMRSSWDTRPTVKTKITSSPSNPDLIGGGLVCSARWRRRRFCCSLWGRTDFIKPVFCCLLFTKGTFCGKKRYPDNVDVCCAVGAAGRDFTRRCK